VAAGDKDKDRLSAATQFLALFARVRTDVI
jgi:hypothetical protein